MFTSFHDCTVLHMCYTCVTHLTPPTRWRIVLERLWCTAPAKWKLAARISCAAGTWVSIVLMRISWDTLEQATYNFFSSTLAFSSPSKFPATAWMVRLTKVWGWAKRGDLVLLWSSPLLTWHIESSVLSLAPLYIFDIFWSFATELEADLRWSQLWCWPGDHVHHTNTNNVLRLSE